MTNGSGTAAPAAGLTGVWNGRGISVAQTTRKQVQTLCHMMQRRKPEVIHMAVVKEVKTDAYTVRVHDDCYRDRTPEEIQETVQNISRTIFASQLRRHQEEQEKLKGEPAV